MAVVPESMTMPSFGALEWREAEDDLRRVVDGIAREVGRYGASAGRSLRDSVTRHEGCRIGVRYQVRGADSAATMEEPHAADWAAHYAAEDTPWDLGGPHPELSLRLTDGSLAPPRPGARVLVPGAGRGHDALALARRGWDVVAIDLVAGLADSVGRELARERGQLIIGDALQLEFGTSFELVWDHTFFCALPPPARAAWGEVAGSALAPGGRYVALIFPTGKPLTEGGPPFGMVTADVTQALGERFSLERDQPVARPVARRTWPERLAWFRYEPGPQRAGRSSER